MGSLNRMVDLGWSRGRVLHRGGWGGFWVAEHRERDLTFSWEVPRSCCGMLGSGVLDFVVLSSHTGCRPVISRPQTLP